MQWISSPRERSRAYLLKLVRAAGQQKISGLIIIIEGGCNYRIAGAKIEVDDHIVMHHASYNRPEFDAETEALVIRMGVR